ncbi:MAG: PorT family protein [Spirochaetaceae bacterium]|jgi:hypothetical protein|nr:PorT family protein [Spirochaetaceae bacterium]
MMKMFLVLLAALVTVTLSVDAQGLLLGGRLGAGFGMHKNGEAMDNMVDSIESYYPGLSVDEKSGVAFAISGYGAYYFTANLGVQAELNFMINQSKEWSGSYSGVSGKLKGTYSSLDIPILLKYDLMNNPVILGLLAGPYLSFTLGDVELEGSGYMADDGAYEADGILAGLTLGLYGGLALGPGRLIGDARFLMDFSPLTIEESGYTDEVIQRFGINVTVGYELSF